MNRIVLLCILLRILHVMFGLERPERKKCIVDGDVVLGGFFPVHNRDKEFICGELQDEGYFELEAMLHAVDEINNNMALLPGLKLGVIAVDSCDSVAQALEEAVDFAKGFVIRIDSQRDYNSSVFSCGANASLLPHFETQKYEKVVAIIGGHSSWVSRQVADLMRIYKIPQVSYQSTNPALSEKGYEYFFRTVPPLNHQIRAILEILKQFSWTYIAVVYADSAYGNLGFQDLNKLIDSENKFVGFSSHQRINVQNSKPQDYDNFMSELLKRKAKVVIVFGDHEMARNLMSAATRARASKKFVWIGSTAWVGRKYVISGNEDVMEGTIGVVHDLKPVNGFNDYLKEKQLRTADSNLNPWFPEYVEKHLNCRLKTFEKTRFNRKYNKTCLENEELPPSCYSMVAPTAHSVRDAVYSVAHALSKMYVEECNMSKSCFLKQSMNGTQLREYLKEVEFPDKNGSLFRFNDKGDSPPRYTIVNLLRDSETNESYWLPVGSYDEERKVPLTLDKSKMKYKSESPEFPESQCSDKCKKGQAKINLDGKKLCWHCTSCMEYQFVENEIRCSDCPDGMLPNANRNGCKEINAEYMHLFNPWAVGCIVFSVIGILLTLCIAAAVARYWNTPVIMSSCRELSCVLIIGIILSFSLTFAIVSKPSDTSCGVVRYCFGLFYTVSYATIALKIHYIHQIFKRAKANKKPKNIKIKSLLLIILALIAVEGTINATWLLHSPPSTEHQHPSRKERILLCKGSDSSGYLVGLVFPFLLTGFCSCYAFNIRGYTGAFNESRYIHFTNYTTCILWLALLPMFIFNKYNSLSVVVLSLLLNLSALVQLVCLFLPKLYIALRRPEKNKHTNITCRDIRQSVNTGM